MHSISRKDLSILDSPFVDERLLFKNYGLTRESEVEFRSVYNEIDVEHRPSLSPFFESKWYLAKHNELELQGYDPIIHFIHFGFDRRYSPHPLIEIDYVESRTGKLGYGRQGLEKFVQLLTAGKEPSSPYFNLRDYAANEAEAPTFPNGLIGHFLERIDDENIFIPCELFDADFYRERYFDVPRGRGRSFLHFVARGDSERRCPGPTFDPEWYLRSNPDLLEAGINPLRHFLEYGLAEGRLPRSKRHFVSSNVSSSFSQATFLPSLASDREKYCGLKQDLEVAREIKLKSVRDVDARLVSVSDPSETMKHIVLPRSENPRVSIIIPVFNEISVTVECLLAIQKANIATDIEVIVADDCSTDPLVKKIALIEGVKYIRSEKNLNFLRNCNAAYKLCKGQYAFLLNNDTQISKGSLEKLVEVLDTDPEIGIVGPRFVFPNGRLQEAGCVVHLDATSTMVGLHARADEPAFSFSREVDYVSGAALLLRRSLVYGDLFDENLAPAYCEDLELCLRVRAQGYRIYYVADACVVHHLSVTMADHGRKIENITINQEKVLKKWQALIQQMNRVRTIAFFLPQFHSIAENDLWWGKGFTEWTNVSKALPSYEGHYQPHLPSDLGFYDLRLPETLLHQALLVQRYGLEGLCFYYYNFGGRTLLQKPVELLLSQPDIPLKFCFCWANENWSRRWDGGTRDLLLEQLYDPATLENIVADLCRAAKDERYIRVGGKPLFLIYRPLLIPEIASVSAMMREQAAKLGESDLHLVFVESMESVDAGKNPRELGFNASVEFPPHGLAVPAKDARATLKAGWAGHRYDYVETVKRALQRPSVPWKRYPTVFPSWDNTARQPLLGTSFDHCSPDIFQFYVEEKIAECQRGFVGEERLMFVNAWNEWAEGAHLEPDVAYGHRWLEALRQALHKQSWLF